ncbi:hypothetical protein EOM82_00305 [bacterium]|nr:hypothetical protein [bacterium]
MQKDRTGEVEKRVEAIRISAIDSCSFYAPKEDTFIAVKLCAYCKYGKFAENENNGLCKYRWENTEK